MPTAGTITKTFIRVGLEDTFACISDLTRHSEWASDKLEVKSNSSGDIAVGHQYQSVAKIQNKDILANIRVTKFSPHTLFGFVVEDETGRHSHEFNLSPERAGSLLEQKVLSELSVWNYIKFKLVGWPRREKSARENAYKKLRSILEPETISYIKRP